MLQSGYASVLALESKRLTLRDLQNTPIAKLIKEVMSLVGYVEHLERTTPTDIDNRLENLKVCSSESPLTHSS